MPNPGLDPELVGRLQARILNGEKPIQIAEAEGCSYSSVMRAKAKIPADVLERMSAEQVEVISDLIMQQLESGIEASIEIAEQVKDDEWRFAQTAAHLATLYGVVTDKSIRLLEASENAARARASIDAPGDEAYSN
jgi:hypothetical protein